MRGHERPSDPTGDSTEPGFATTPDAGTEAGVTDPTLPRDEASTPVAETSEPTRAQASDKDPLRHTRTSGAFAGLWVALVLLVLLIIFILQNTAKAPIHFLWFDGRVSVAVALLIAMAVGMAVTVLGGGLRIMQLRRRIRQERKQRVNAR